MDRCQPRRRPRKAKYDPAEIEAWLSAVVDNAPPLTEEQRNVLRSLFRS